MTGRLRARRCGTHCQGAVVRALFLLLLLALAGAAPLVAADKKRKDEPKLPIPPPQPVAQEVTVRRGESVDIRLKIYGRKYENLKYLIRTAPQSGKVGEPRAVTQEASVVTYRPPDNLTIKKEKFTYAVQNSAGVSAPVDVNVTIIDEAANLIAPDTIDFAPLLAGGAALKEVEISNIGGSLAEGEVRVGEPWSIEGPAKYKLKGGDRQKFILVYQPKAAGIFRSEIRYSSHPERATTLRGVGQAAIAAEPAELRLQAASGDVSRLGRIELVNHTTEAQALTLTGDPRLRVPASLKLPPGGRETISVAVDERDPSRLESTLVIDGGGLQTKVPVTALAVGPVLKVQTATPRFANLRPGQQGKLAVSVENVGGAEGFWKYQIPAPFKTEAESIRLATGEKKEIQVAANPTEPGSYRGTLHFEGEQQTKEATLELEVLDSSAPAPSVASSANSAPSSVPATGAPAASNPTAREQAEARQKKVADSRISALLYLREQVKVRNVESDRATLDWPTALTSAKSCRLEVRTLRMDDTGHLRTEWQVPPAVTIKENGERFTAEMRSLRPSSLHTVRVVPLLDDNQPGEPLFITQFETPPAKEPPIRITGFRVAMFLLVVLAAGAFAWKRVRETRER